MFVYSGYNENGELKSGKLNVNTIEEANGILNSQNIIVTEIKESKSKDFFYKRKINNSELAKFSESLSIYLNSGIKLFQALELLSSKSYKNKKMNIFINKLYIQIKEGNSLFNALNNQEIFIVPSFYQFTLKIAEENGFLENSLLEISNFISKQDDIDKKVSSSMFYPGFIVATSIVMIFYMLTTIVPKITSMYEGLNQELPSITQKLISISSFLINYYYFIIFAFILIIISHTIFNKINLKYSTFVDKMKLNIPLFGNIGLKNEIIRFSYVFRILLQSGVNYSYSIQLSSKVLKNKVLTNIFDESFKRVTNGEQFSKTLLNKKIIPEDFIQNLQLGEDSSEVQKMMENISNIYVKENEHQINIIMSLFEPALMLFIGVTIGFIVAALILPIFSMNVG